MQRQRDGLVPIAEAFSDLSGPVKALRDASPQALHHFTRFDQVNQLVSASEADPDLGFMARMMALCSLPRTNPGTRIRYIRQNGPYTLVMTAGGKSKLPGHPLCQKRSINTGLGQQGARRLSVGAQLREGATPLKSEG